MSELIGIVIFGLGVLISIGLHEIGHLVPAKKFGVRVPTYMVGFGPTIWSTTKNETEYGIKLFPMGGYIRMIGMYPPQTNSHVDPNSLGRMRQLVEEARFESLKEITDSDDNRVFYKLSVPKKITVMFGGPFMNLIIATVLFTVTLSGIGALQPTTTINSVIACEPTPANPSGLTSTDGSCGTGKQSAAALAGLQAGDKLVSINATPINNWTDFPSAVANSVGNTIPVVVVRAGEELKLPVTVGTAEEVAGSPRPFIGVGPTLESVRIPVTQIPGQMWKMTTLSVQGLISFPREVVNLGKSLFTDTPRDLEGPVSVIGVGRVSGQITGTDAIDTRSKVFMLLMLLASLNLFLFLFNLVPLLPLDGGHVAGAIYEGLRKTKARIFRQPMPGPVDTARMLPVAYVATLLILAMSLVVMVADIIKPLNLF